MTIETTPGSGDHRPAWQRALSRADVLSGLMFMGIAIFGLAVSWNYPVGTGTRMGTGYVPRLFLWILFGLGVLTLLVGLREGDDETHPPFNWRPIVFIPAALLTFALTIDRIGFLVGGLLTVLVAGFANRDSRPVEVIISAIALVAFVWLIFVKGLGLTFPIWPGD